MDGRATHHHDSPSVLIAQPLHHFQIDFPAILLDTVVVTDLCAERVDEHCVLREPWSGQEDVAWLHGRWGEDDREDQIEGLSNAVGLSHCQSSFPERFAKLELTSTISFALYSTPSHFL